MEEGPFITVRLDYTNGDLYSPVITFRVLKKCTGLASAAAELKAFGSLYFVSFLLFVLYKAKKSTFSELQVKVSLQVHVRMQIKRST